MCFLRKTVRWSNEAEISLKEQKRTEEIMLLPYPVLGIHFFLPFLPLADVKIPLYRHLGW